MKRKSPNVARPEPPPWPVILTALTLVLTSAWLVFMSGWEPWKAFFVVVCAALGIIAVLLAILMIWAGPEDRAELWHQGMKTCRDDLDLLLNYFRIRK